MTAGHGLPGLGGRRDRWLAASCGRGASVRAALVLAAAAIAAPGAWTAPLGAHSGPPFPIVSDRLAGPYLVSLWTDPDATDDGTAAGRFWVQLAMADRGAVPAGTRADVSVAPVDRPGSARTVRAEAVAGNPARQLAVLVLDHEGRFAVRVSLAGPRGAAAVESAVDATYDLRPPRAMLFLYLMPFLLAGFVWGKLLVTRARARQGGRDE